MFVHKNSIRKYREFKLQRKNAFYMILTTYKTLVINESYLIQNCH